MAPSLTSTNTYGQPLGELLPGWAPPSPLSQRLQGRNCYLAKIDPQRHAAPLFQALGSADFEVIWTYLPDPRPPNVEAFASWLTRRSSSPLTLGFVIVEPASHRILGTISYLRIDPPNGSIEIGSVIFPPSLQRTGAATESVFLLLQHAFDLGYRRVEWKCDSLNQPSRAAAVRFGFTFEGIFRQAMVTHGRNRDTAWYAIIDREWPRLKGAYERWLAPNNFDAAGIQHERLSQLTATHSR